MCMNGHDIYISGIHTPLDMALPTRSSILPANKQQATTDTVTMTVTSSLLLPPLVEGTYTNTSV